MADPPPEQAALAPDLARPRIPPVTVWYGEPMTFERVDATDGEVQREAATAVFERVREMYDALDAAVRSTLRRSVVRAARAGRLPG